MLFKAHLSLFGIRTGKIKIGKALVIQVWVEAGKWAVGMKTIGEGYRASGSGVVRQHQQVMRNNMIPS